MNYKWLDHTKLTKKFMITIVMIVLIAAVGSMYIGNMNSNAFAKSSHHNHDRHVCIGHKLISIGHKHVCINDIHGSSDNHQGEIILSSPGLPRQQLSISSSSQLPQSTIIQGQPTKSTIIIPGQAIISSQPTQAGQLRQPDQTPSTQAGQPTTTPLTQAQQQSRPSIPSQATIPSLPSQPSQASIPAQPTQPPQPAQPTLPAQPFTPTR
jgi:hypothetical protein